MITSHKLTNKEMNQKLILDYIRDIYNKEKRFVSKREIRKVFHIELYNYFNNIFEMYREVDIDVPLCYCNKEYAKKQIIKFLIKKSNKGVYILSRELENILGIKLKTYFNNIEELYMIAGVKFDLYKKRKYSIEHPIYSSDEIENIKKKISNFIKKSSSNGYYPGVYQIQKDLNIAFYKYFSSIKEAYKEADIDYKRISPITLGKEKERILTDIVILLLSKMQYHIKRVSIYDRSRYNKGEDISVIDIHNENILVELKAYRKDYNISRREICQLDSYLKNQKVNTGIFVTTSNKVNYKLPNIKIINGYKIIELLKKYNLSHLIENVRWVQNKRVSLYERIEFKKRKRQDIINFIVNSKKTPTIIEIENKLNLDMRTYFNTSSLKYLIKKIKNNFNTYNDQVYMDHQQVFLDNWIASHSKCQSQYQSSLNVVLQPLHLVP